MRVTPHQVNFIDDPIRYGFDRKIIRFLDSKKYNFTEDEIDYIENFIQIYPNIINSIPYEINAKLNNMIFSIDKIPKLVFIIANIFYNTIIHYNLQETTNPNHFYIMVKLTTYVIIIEKYFHFLDIQDNIEKEKERIIELIDDSIELIQMNCHFPIVQSRKKWWSWCI